MDIAAGPNPEASDEVLLEDLAAVASASEPVDQDTDADMDQRGGTSMMRAESTERRGRSVRYDDNIDSDDRSSRSLLRVPLPSAQSPARPTIPSIRRAHSVGASSHGGSHSRSALATLFIATHRALYLPTLRSHLAMKWCAIYQPIIHEESLFRRLQT